MVRISNLKTHSNRAGTIIQGGFSQAEARRHLMIKRINGTLAVMLLIALFITALNYYFATTREMVLNDLNREIIITNDENFDLQYKLDKMKSFTNVGNKVESSQLLKKAEEVIEIPYIAPPSQPQQTKYKASGYGWTLGY